MLKTCEGYQTKTATLTKVHVRVWETVLAHTAGVSQNWLELGHQCKASWRDVFYHGTRQTCLFSVFIFNQWVLKYKDTKRYHYY